VLTLKTNAINPDKHISTAKIAKRTATYFITTSF
jgi:hypothetical protein